MKLIRVLPEAETSDVVEALIGLSRLSAAELARRAGVAEGQVSKWRRGLVEPTVPLLLKLVAAAGLEWAFIVPREDSEPVACSELPSCGGGDHSASCEVAIADADGAP